MNFFALHVTHIFVCVSSTLSYNFLNYVFILDESKGPVQAPGGVKKGRSTQYTQYRATSMYGLNMSQKGYKWHDPQAYT